MSRLLFIQDNGVNENIGVMSIAGMVKIVRTTNGVEIEKIKISASF